MRITEDRHPGEPWLIWKLGNLTAIDDSYIKSIGIAWLFKEGGQWDFKPLVTGNDSLFYNAVFFFRLTFIGWIPAGVFFMLRWAEIGPVLGGKPRSFLQVGFGYKLNGRFGLPLRVQNDVSSAAGVTGPNVGQATGFNYGTH